MSHLLSKARRLAVAAAATLLFWGARPMPPPTSVSASSPWSAPGSFS